MKLLGDTGCGVRSTDPSSSCAVNDCGALVWESPLLHWTRVSNGVLAVSLSA